MPEPKTAEAYAAKYPNGGLGAVITRYPDESLQYVGDSATSVPVVIIEKADYEKLVADAARVPMPEEVIIDLDKLPNWKPRIVLTRRDLERLGMKEEVSDGA